MLNAMRQSKHSRKQTAGRIYAAVVARSREPVFFARFGVPDTLDGRFDLLTLHVWLLLQRLQADKQLSQALVDAVFVGFDEALRELGTGDIGMGRRMKKFADAFYGRLKAYGDAADEAAMEAALRRNLYRGEPVPCAGAMAAYVLQAREHLVVWKGAPHWEAAPDFGALPAEE